MSGPGSSKEKKGHDSSTHNSPGAAGGSKADPATALRNHREQLRRRYSGFGHRSMAQRAVPVQFRKLNNAPREKCLGVVDRAIFGAEVDATSASLSEGDLTAVGRPLQIGRRDGC